MKGTNPICLLCRHNLRATGGLRAAQWQLNAHISTSRAHRPGAESVQGPGASHENPDSPGPESPSFRRLFTGKNSADRSDEDAIRQAMRTRSTGPWRPKTKGGERMDALFKEIVQQQVGDNNIPTEPVGSRGVDLLLIENINKMEKIMTQEGREAQAFAFLKTEIYPQVQAEGAHIPQIFSKALTKLMEKLVKKKEADMWSDTLPNVAEILRVYVDFGHMRPELFCTLVGRIVLSLAQMSLKPADYASIEEYEKHIARRDTLVNDLVECWKLLSLPKAVTLKSTGGNELVDDFWLPRLSKVHIRKYQRKGNFSTAFVNLFPQYHFISTGPNLTVLAIATYALLRDPARSNQAARTSAVRFTSIISQLIKVLNIREKALRQMVTQRFPDLERYLMEEWKGITEELHEEDAAAAPIHASKRLNIPQKKGTPSKTFDSASLGTRLSQAYGSRNHGEVDRLWLEFVGVDTVPTGPRLDDLRNHPELFDSFINTYMALNQTNKAVQVWNYLSTIGLEPSLMTWNVMLDGCKKARNASGLRNVWQKLVASGTRLDAALWTTRISGLIECGAIADGIAALEEMPKLWKESQARPGLHAVQPTVQPVNAALTGLVRHRRLDLAEKLLVWAGQQGIEPDIVTFNTLLRPMIRDKRNTAVQGLFKAMKDLGVHADEATFTIVLDGTLANSTSEDTEYQVSIVEAVFAQMEAAGLKTNLQTYGKMIYLLLRSGDRSQEAVKAVLAHLWAKGHELSPHIYTMLVEHYFSRSPPDLDAVDSLLLRRRLLDYDDMDRVFYERVIKGFAQAGEVSRALEIHKKLTSLGNIIALGTQVELLRQLVWQERWDDAKEMATTTMKNYKEQNPAASGAHNSRFWDHAFWHVAATHRLIEPESNASDKPPASE